MSISNIKFIALLIVLIPLMTGCLINDDLNLSFKSYEPIDLKDGIELSSAVDENIDTSKLLEIYKDVYHDSKLWSLRSLLVFRNNKLVAESYLKDTDDIIQRHLIWSATKQVMGILVGIAIENQVITDLDDPMSNYFDSELIGHEDKKDITIRNLLTMQSGIDFNNEGLNGDSDIMLRQLPKNSVEYILDLPVNAKQGTVFNYNDGNPHLLSAIIQKQVGKPTDEWADDFLFSKIGVTNYNWVRYRDGITLGAFGIETTPRELAKIALCVANNGQWNTTQVIDSNWVDEMTSIQVYRGEDKRSLGYYWWIDQERNVHSMDGHGGQFAFIVPDKDLVVVMTSFPNTQGDYQITPDEAAVVLDRIIDASY